MQVSPISNNYRSEMSFNGTVHKSVKKYIKELRDGVIKSEGNATGVFSSNRQSVENLDYAALTLQNIIKRLNVFMEKTADDTELRFMTMDSRVYPKFRNKNAEIRAFRPAGWVRGNSTANAEGANVGLPFINRKKAFLFGFKKASYNIEDIKILYNYVKELVENVIPADVDKALEESVIISEKKANLEKQKKRYIEHNIKEGQQDIDLSVKKLKEIEI